MYAKTLSLLFLFALVSVHAQERFALKAMGGFVIPHRPVMVGLVQGHTEGLEFTYERKLNGSQAWHDVYHKPTIGLSLLALNLGNPSQLGYAFGLTPYFRLPLRKKNDALAVKLGLGLGLLTKHFDPLENHKNIAIGSTLNASITVGLAYRVKLSEKLSVVSGFQLQHFSNGAWKAPNLGINLPLISLGFEMTTPARTIPVMKPPVPASMEGHQSEYYISLRLGAKELLSTGNRKFPTYALHLSRVKYLSPKFDYTLFGDVLYNSSIGKQRDEQSLPSLKPAQFTQFGLGVGLENKYGRFSMYLQAAVYLYSNQLEAGRIYNRLGVKEQIGKRYYLSFGLKSHLAKADYLEIGWGIRLY